MSRAKLTEEQAKAAVAAIEALFYQLGRHRRHPWSKVGPCVYCDTCHVRLYHGEPLDEQEKADLPDTKCIFAGCGMPLQFEGDGYARHLEPPPDGVTTHTPHYDLPNGTRVIDLTEMAERNERARAADPVDLPTPDSNGEPPPTPIHGEPEEPR